MAGHILYSVLGLIAAVDSQAGLETIIMLGVGIAVTGASILLAQQQSKAVLQDDKPTVLTNRGEWLPRLSGRVKTSYAIVHVDGRYTKQESVGKKSGSFENETDVFYEFGLHVCLIGPVTALRRITKDGETVLRGPVTPAMLPSGSSLTIGNDGVIEIYWGSGDQPAITGIAARMGITALTEDPQFPWHVMVWWKPSRLGTTATWRLFEYEWDRPPFNSQLVGSDPWIDDTRGTPSDWLDISATTDGNPGAASVTVNTKVSNQYRTGKEVELSSAGVPDGIYPILRSQIISGGKTQIFINATMEGLTDIGSQVRTFATANDAGCNAAHMLDEILHEPYPHGAGVERRWFDQKSMDAFGQLMATEDIRSRCTATNGETAKAVAAAIIQDCGVLVPWIPRDRKFRWVPVREPVVGEVPTLPQGMVSGLPSIRARLDEPEHTSVVFEFTNQERNFRADTVKAFDDAWAQLLGGHNEIKNAIPTSSVRNSVIAIKNRRGQEALPNIVNAQIFATRGARELYPGLPLVVFGFPITLRIMGVDAPPLSNRVTLTVINDSYGVPASTFVDDDSGGKPTIPDGPLADVAAALVEVPWGYSKLAGTTLIVVPRIRDNTSITAAEIHLSPDDVTYEFKGLDTSAYTGGTLDASLAAETPMIMDPGPVFDIEGPDIAIVEDLSSDAANFRLGRQVVVIENAAGDQEFWHVDSVSVLGGGQAQLGKTIRGRYGSEKLAFAAGDRLFIFRSDTVQSFSDLIVAAGQNVYVKAAPKSGDTLPLSDVTAESKLPLKGEGVAPMPPANFRLSNWRNTFGTGEDLTLRWAYRTKAGIFSGAGDVGAGTAQSPGEIEGFFVVRLRNTGGSLIAERVVGAVNEYVYTNANLVADWGSEPTIFKLGLVATHNGISCPEQQITVTRV